MATQAELEAMFNSGSPAQDDLASAFESAAPVAPSAPVERGIGEELVRQLGLTARAGIEGIGSIPNTIGDAAGLNSSKGLSDLLTKIGLPVPQGDMENLSQSVVRGGASAVLPIGIGAQLARGSASPVAQGVGAALAKDPGQQMVLSGIGGGAAEIAKQGGAEGGGQMAAGVLTPVALSLLARGASPVVSRINNVVSSATDSGATRAAGRVAVDVSKDRAGAVARALREGEPVETAAQAAVPAGSAEFSGLEQMVAGRNPSIYGPDGTIVKDQAQYIDDLWKQLQASTKPMRESELANANGMVPLKVGTIISNIDQKLTTPGLRSSDTANTVLTSFKNKILDTVGPDGVIDSRDLYTIRKEMGNKIKVLARQEQWDKALTEGLVHDVQHSIDQAIGNASGSLRKDGTSAWTDYLKQFSTGAKRIEGIGERKDIASRMGNAGREEAQRIFNVEGAPFSLPNLLSRPMMVANSMIRFLEGKGGQKTRNELSRLMQPGNKEELAKLMGMEMAMREGSGISMADIIKRGTMSGAYGANSSNDR